VATGKTAPPPLAAPFRVQLVDEPRAGVGWLRVRAPGGPAGTGASRSVLVGYLWRAGLPGTRWLVSDKTSRVENRRSGFSFPVAADEAFASSPQSGLAWLCFLFPLVEPDRRISRIRLSEKTHAENSACNAACNF